MEATRMNSETTTGGVNSMRQGGAANKAGGAGGANASPGEAPAAVSHNMDALLKRLMKFKHLEEDNKKLKNLLK